MIDVKVAGSLEKIFPDSDWNGPELRSDVAARGEVYSFQVAVRFRETDNHYLRVALESELNAQIRLVEAVPVHLAANRPDDDFLRTTPGLYPDLLDELECKDRFRVMPRQWRTLWVTVRIGEDCPAGTYPVKLLFSDIDWQGKWRPETVATAEIELKVLPFTLPEQQLLRYEWFHADCLSAYYRVPAWSEEHWRIVENFVHNAVSHGINVLYVPLWTPPLDTEIGGERPTCQLLDVHVEADGAYRFGFEKLERYLEMGKRLGVKRFGISHLVTQWGAEFTPKIVETLGGGRDRKLFGWHVGSDDPAFKAFLTALMPQLLAVLRRHGLTGRCFFSISDEPSVEHLETCRSVVEWIVPLLEDFPTVEALSSFDFYQNGLVRNPVPCNNHIEPFVGHVKELWTYYCCSQEDRVPNRCMAMPSRRNRIMGLLAYVYDLTGFLQWGFNFYFSQYSKRLIDPFACTDAGGAFPAGDPFMVYPGEYGVPLDSIRHEVFREGLQDLRALKLLESRIGRGAVLALLNEGLEKPLSMTEYPRTDAWLLGVRSRVYAGLAE